MSTENAEEQISEESQILQYNTFTDESQQQASEPLSRTEKIRLKIQNMNSSTKLFFGIIWNCLIILALITLLPFFGIIPSVFSILMQLISTASLTIMYSFFKLISPAKEILKKVESLVSLKNLIKHVGVVTNSSPEVSNIIKQNVDFVDNTLGEFLYPVIYRVVDSIIDDKVSPVISGKEQIKQVGKPKLINV
eukprot:gene6110-10117_t